MIEKNIKTFRLNINLPLALMHRVDDYANKMNINRTSAVAILLSTALNNISQNQNLK